MASTTRMCAVAVAAALVLGSCGGGSDESGSEGGDAGGVSVDLAAAEPLSEVTDLEGSAVDADAEVADELVAEMGVEGALRGVLLALDRGYDVDQIVDAPPGALTTDGTIDGVEPAGESAGVFEETTTEIAENGVLERVVALLPGGSGPPEPVPISESLEQLRARDDEGRGLVFLILALARAGYDVEQITTAIVADHSVASTYATGPDVPDGASNLDRLCPVLVSNGERIAPTLVDSSICRDRFVDTRLIGGSNDEDGADATSDPQTPDEGDPDGGAGEAGTALEGIPTGVYEGTIDTSTGGFRTGVAIDTAEITLQYANGGVLVDWTVSWTEDAGECATTGTDSWSGSEVTLADATSFSIRGTREFQPGSDSTCDLGAEASSFSRVLRFEVDGSTVTSDLGVGVATIDLGS